MYGKLLHLGKVWRSASLGSEPLLVSVKNITLPITVFSFPLLLRNNFWWEAKEQRSHRPTVAKVNDLGQTQAPSYQKPQFEGCGINKVTAKQTATRRANHRMELHHIHLTAPFCPISEKLFCRDSMISELLAI